MQIGKAGEPVTRISRAFPDRVEVRGHDLAADLMGRLAFTEYFHLLLTGREPNEDERFFLDLVLVSIAEHGLMPSNIAARMTLAADPGSLQGAVAAGILGAGPVILGAVDECARLLAAAVAEGKDAAEIARRDPCRGRQGAGLRPSSASTARSARRADPRARRRAGCERAARRIDPSLRDAVAEAWGKPLTLNVSLPIAAVMLDLGYPPAVVKAVPILARTASLLAHLAEEREQPIGFLLAAKAEDAIEYRDD